MVHASHAAVSGFKHTRSRVRFYSKQAENVAHHVDIATQPRTYTYNVMPCTCSLRSHMGPPADADADTIRLLVRVTCMQRACAECVALFKSDASYAPVAALKTPLSSQDVVAFLDTNVVYQTKSIVAAMEKKDVPSNCERLPECIKLSAVKTRLMWKLDTEIGLAVKARLTEHGRLCIVCCCDGDGLLLYLSSTLITVVFGK